MIWTIIGIVLIVLSVVFTKLEAHYWTKFLNTDDRKYSDISDALYTPRVLCIILSCIVNVIVILCIIVSHSPIAQLDIQKVQEKRNAYVRLLEENKDITIQNQLYQDIIEYNSELRIKQYCNHSLWTNWLYNDGWDDLEPIEIK